MKVGEYACFKNIPSLLKKRDLKGMVIILDGPNNKSLIGNIISIGSKNLTVKSEAYKNNRHYKWEDQNLEFIYVPTEKLEEENIDKSELYKRVRKGLFIEVNLLNKLFNKLDTIEKSQDKSKKTK